MFMFLNLQEYKVPLISYGYKGTNLSLSDLTIKKKKKKMEVSPAGKKANHLRKRWRLPQKSKPRV